MLVVDRKVGETIVMGGITVTVRRSARRHTLCGVVCVCV